jgi:hypothetical protein
MYLIHRTVAVFLVVLCFASLESPVSARASSSFAGRWHVSTVITCSNSKSYHYTCDQAAGEDLAAFGTRGTVVTLRSTTNYVVGKTGKFSVHATDLIIEKAPHRGSPGSCDPNHISDDLWTGTCRITIAGHGHIARGKTGMSDFWYDRGTSTVRGGGPFRPHVIHFSRSSDSGIPAAPGVYRTARFLALLHLRPVSGVTATRHITHSH